MLFFFQFFFFVTVLFLYTQQNVCLYLVIPGTDKCKKDFQSLKASVVHPGHVSLCNPLIYIHTHISIYFYFIPFFLCNFHTKNVKNKNKRKKNKKKIVSVCFLTLHIVNRYKDKNMHQYEIGRAQHAPVKPLPNAFTKINNAITYSYFILFALCLCVCLIILTQKHTHKKKKFKQQFQH